MTKSEADEYRADGVWPTRRITPYDPPPPPLSVRRSRARRILEFAWGLIIALVLLGAAGGVAYLLATGQT